MPEELHGQWRRQWLNAHEKGTRQRVPALVDVNNPGLTGGVQNQPDFQAGAVDHRTHFASDVPRFVREAMGEYAALTGREYTPVHDLHVRRRRDTWWSASARSPTTPKRSRPICAARARRSACVSIKLLQPFPEAELVAALDGKKAVTVLERSDSHRAHQLRHAGAVQGARERRRRCAMPASRRSTQLPQA